MYYLRFFPKKVLTFLKVQYVAQIYGSVGGIYLKIYYILKGKMAKFCLTRRQNCGLDFSWQNHETRFCKWLAFIVERMFFSLVTRKLVNKDSFISKN